MLKQARSNRERAERARRLARSLTEQDIIDNFTRYADELEQQALALEERACALAETVGKTRSLSADIRLLVEEARARLKAMR